MKRVRGERNPLRKRTMQTREVAAGLEDKLENLKRHQ